MPRSLSYPSGATPGFDPSHPASVGISSGHGCSLIASADGGARNILTGSIGALVGTVGGANSIIGPSCSFASNASNARSFSGNAAVKDDNNTLACICVPQTATTNNNTFIANGSVFGVAIGFTTAGLWRYLIAGQSAKDASSIPAVSLDTPYFVAVSSNLSATNFVVVNISTGQLYSQSTTAPSTWGGASTGIYRLGAGANSGQSQPGLVSHGMFAPSYMSIAQLRLWAADPWSFWYPR